MPHGFVEGLSDYGSKLATATAHEMSDPGLAAEIPNSADTFNYIKSNVTGDLPVAPNFGGQVGNRAGQMLAYDPIGSITPVRSAIAALTSGAGAETGKQAAAGTPYE